MDYPACVETEEINVIKGNKVDIAEAINVVARINKFVKWEHENEAVFFIIREKPKFCYFATLKNAIVGYVILREADEDRHLHVSWIATDLLNRGVGTYLMHKVFNKNKKLSHKTLTLYYSKENKKLKQFYEKIAQLENAKIFFQDIEESKNSFVTYEME